MQSHGSPEQKKLGLEAEICDLKVDLTLSLNDDLSCPITRSFFFKPVTTECGHTFEETALELWQHENDACPTCRRDDLTFVPNIFLEDLIDRILERIRTQ